MSFSLRAFGFGTCLMLAHAGAGSLALGPRAWLGATLPLASLHALAGFRAIGGREAYLAGRLGIAWACAGAAIIVALAAWALSAWLAVYLSFSMTPATAQLLIACAWLGAAAYSVFSLRGEVASTHSA